MRPRSVTRILTAAAALVAAAASGCAPSGKQPASRSTATLRVVTWNIHGCREGIEPIVDVLRGLSADVICLQEAEVGTTHTGGADQAAQIARQLDMHHFAAGSALPGGGRQCMAILSRHELHDPGLLDAGTGRIYGVTAVIRREDSSVRVVSVHLTSTHRAELKHAATTAQARSKEATDLAERLKTWPDEWIIAGDLNSFPGMPAYDLLADRVSGPTTSLPTYPSTEPVLSIDHVLRSRGLGVHRLSVMRTLASDHLPVVADITSSDQASGR